MKCGSSVSNYNYCEWFYITQLWLCWTALLYSCRYLSILNSPPFKKDLFMYFRLFVAMHGLSVVVARGGRSSPLWCTGFSLRWLLLLWSAGSRVCGLSSCGPRARAQVQQLWCTGLVALRHAGSSRIRDRTRVSSIGRWILYH